MKLKSSIQPWRILDHCYGDSLVADEVEKPPPSLSRPRPALLDAREIVPPGGVKGGERTAKDATQCDIRPPQLGQAPDLRSVLENCDLWKMQPREMSTRLRLFSIGNANKRVVHAANLPQGVRKVVQTSSRESYCTQMILRLQRLTPTLEPTNYTVNK